MYESKHNAKTNLNWFAQEAEVDSYSNYIYVHQSKL